MCKARDRYFDLDAVRERTDRTDETYNVTERRLGRNVPNGGVESKQLGDRIAQNPAGAPPLDWWNIPPSGYPGSHYATYFREFVMSTNAARQSSWSDCGHDAWRPGIILDPFAGSGTTLEAALGHGRSATGIDLDRRNLELAQQRLGMFPLDVHDHTATPARRPAMPDDPDTERDNATPAAAPPPATGVRLAHLVQTCSACPSQWDAWDEHGTYYYVRFRWGFLSVNRRDVDGEEVFGEQISDGLDGWLSTEDMLARTGMVLTTPEADHA